MNARKKTRNSPPCWTVCDVAVPQRRPCPLFKRIIDVSPVEKFLELQESGQSPVGLFPRRAECAEFNDKMLSRLPSKKEKIACVDEIDQTSSTHFE